MKTTNIKEKHLFRRAKKSENNTDKEGNVVIEWDPMEQTYNKMSEI